MKSIPELEALVAELRAWVQNPQRDPVALVTVIRTRGSTFRRVGAAMLVHTDGHITNPLAGGCPQHDLVQRARTAMASGRFEYVAYNEESGFDLIMEMGCGGTLEVAIEPFASGNDVPFLDGLEAALATGRPFTLSTHFPPSDGVIRPGRELGSRLSAPFEGITPGSAASAEGDHGAIRLVEAFGAPITVVLAGAGEEAARVGVLAEAVGWRVVVVDDSPERMATFGRPRDRWQYVLTTPARLTRAVRLDGNSALLALTHNLELDIAYLGAAAGAGAFYLGALGSRERARRIRDAADAARVHVPAGLDIGSNTPAEIALAILAEIMACREGRAGSSLSSTDGPIHGWAIEYV